MNICMYVERERQRERERSRCIPDISCAVMLNLMIFGCYILAASSTPQKKEQFSHFLQDSAGM